MHRTDDGECCLHTLCVLLDLPPDASIIAIFEGAARLEKVPESSGRAYADYHELWEPHRVFPNYVVLAYRRLSAAEQASFFHQKAHGGAL